VIKLRSLRRGIYVHLEMAIENFHRFTASRFLIASRKEKSLDRIYRKGYLDLIKMSSNIQFIFLTSNQLIYEQISSVFDFQNMKI
jgi:uncharacterized protein Yka (UPF0111/DUF47 family)